MSISHYIKEIGRGKDGARALNREQACDAFARLLDGTVTDLELGAFCLAMRIKGETADEMAGFLQATEARLQRVPVAPRPAGTRAVVLPCYNGARKLPALTALLALLLARAGLPVLLHGTPTENHRVSTQKVLEALDLTAWTAIQTIAPGELAFVPTALLCPGLQRLLALRRVIGLRNSAHSLVKLMNPCQGDAVVVGSYTHPEYLHRMAATLCLLRRRALLLRGTEGEPVADARRTPAMTACIDGTLYPVEAGQSGTLTDLPQLPGPDASATADYIRAVLAGQHPVPPPIALQVTHILRLANEL